MYTFKFNDKEIITDKFIMENINFKGDIHLVILDTEEDVAHYTFFKLYFKLSRLATNRNYTLMHNNKGEIVTDEQLDNLIQKNFPIEIEKILKRKILSEHEFYSYIMSIKNGFFLKYWIEYEEYLISKLPKEDHVKFENIKIKSVNYVKEYFDIVVDIKKL